MRPDFQQLFEAGPGMAAVLDLRLRVVAATDAYLAAHGLARDEAVGRTIFEIAGDCPALRESLERVRATSKPDTMAVHASGDRHLTAVNSPLVDEWRRLSGIVHRVEDVTAFATNDDDSSELLQMRREILQRSEELAEANHELRAASEAKNDFLARMSHEMRSPLTAVMGFAELLGHSELDGRQRERLGMIRKACDHLLTLMNEVLDLSRIEAGSISISLESVAFAPLVEDTLALMRPLASVQGVRLRPFVVEPGNGHVLADNQRLRQVLINLVSNAIKYNREGGEVRVEAAAHGDSVRLTVTDTGRGLTEGELDKLFVPFERLDAPAYGIEGVGLGLVLTRTLVEAMGGELGVESEPGVGTRFWITLDRALPATLEQPLDPDDPLLESRAYPGMRTLLYVEDTLANVRLIEGILERRPGVLLRSATHGEDGYRLAREHRPDLILLDLHLPDMEGDELLERLRRDRATSGIPIVVLSADAKRERAPLLAAGASAFLTKPIGVRRLLEVIDRFLGAAREDDAQLQTDAEGAVSANP